MLNALLYVFVFGFVAIAALGHVLVFTAIMFGRGESIQTVLERSPVPLHEALAR